MSMVVLQTPFRLDDCCTPEPEEQFQTKDEAVVIMEDEEDHPAQSDVWSAIQAQKTADSPVAPPYVHPLVRRSSSSMSQESLQICTESLGSETGSDDFSAVLDELDVEDYLAKIETDKEEESRDRLVMKGEMWSETENGQRKQKEIASVNYHCSISKRSPARSFPPPLPSICCRNAPCLQVRPRRRDGRLVMDAVPAPSQNYLQAQREGGRLLLSFIDATVDFANFDGASSDGVEIEQPREQHQTIDEELGQITEMEAAETEAFEQVLDEEEEEEEEEEEDEEEEVEVVDRGTVVEVKVSTQPQQQSGGAMKVLRSSLVINKFVGGAPMSSNPKCELPPPENEDIPNPLQTTAASPASRRPPPTTATAAAAVVVASSTISATAEEYNEQGYGGGARPADGEDDGRHLALDNKMLFTSKRRNREELLHSVRRCSQLRRPLFIWEPYCIAT